MTLLAAISLLILGSAAVAVTRKNLIHAALWFVVTWFGVAIFFLWAGAQFIGLVQVFVYVGAVSMVVLFAMLLTRPGREFERAITPKTERRITAGVLIASAVFGVMGGAILGTDMPGGFSTINPSPTVRQIGESLMGQNVVALMAIGVLLTAALIGAVVIASADKEDGA